MMLIVSRMNVCCSFFFQAPARGRTKVQPIRRLGCINCKKYRTHTHTVHSCHAEALCDESGCCCPAYAHGHVSDVPWVFTWQTTTQNVLVMTLFVSWLGCSGKAAKSRRLLHPAGYPMMERLLHPGYLLMKRLLHPGYPMMQPHPGHREITRLQRGTSSKIS